VRRDVAARPVLSPGCAAAGGGSVRNFVFVLGVRSAAVAAGGRIITSMTEQGYGELVPVRDGFTSDDMTRLAEDLVASAAQQGVQLTGEGGLLTALTRQVLQTALEVEMAHHLGYD
jgi:hypothetical protein